MTYIIGISFSRGSGYGPINQVYHEELTIGIDSIKYEFKPAVISEFMVLRCEHIPGVLRIWDYREKGAKNDSFLQRFCRFWKKDGR